MVAVNVKAKVSFLVLSTASELFLNYTTRLININIFEMGLRNLGICFGHMHHTVTVT